MNEYQGPPRPGTWRELTAFIDEPPLLGIRLNLIQLMYRKGVSLEQQITVNTQLSDVTHMPHAPWTDAILKRPHELRAIFLCPRSTFFVLHIVPNPNSFILSYCPLWASMKALFIGRRWPWPEDCWA